jgi:hypothetical protein
MRLIALAAFAGLLTTAAHADTMAHCAAAWKAKTGSAVAAGSYKRWSEICLTAKYTADMPASTSATTTPPPGATAMCKDGTYSMSKTSSGRCSSHGGVAKVL